MFTNARDTALSELTNGYLDSSECSDVSELVFERALSMQVISTSSAPCGSIGVLRCRLKVLTDGTIREGSGKLFQIRGAVALKA